MKKLFSALTLFLFLLGLCLVASTMGEIAAPYDEYMNARFPSNIFFKGERAEMGEAIFKNKIRMVKGLIKKGINVNQLPRENEGFTYLSYAVFLRNRMEIVKILLSAKADPNIMTKVDFTNYKAPNIKGPIPELQKYILPLPIAARDNNIEYMKILLEAGANPNLYKHDAGFANIDAAIIYAANPFHWDGDYDKKKISSDIKNRIDLLLKYGADINAQDSVGDTALDAAERGEHFEIAHYLLDKGIDPNLSKRLVFNLEFGITPQMLQTRSEETRQEYYESHVKLLKRVKQMQKK